MLYNIGLPFSNSDMGNWTNIGTVDELPQNIKQNDLIIWHMMPQMMQWNITYDVWTRENKQKLDAQQKL